MLLNILFIGQFHRINDPRLFYREILSLSNDNKNAHFYFLRFEKEDNKFTKYYKNPAIVEKNWEYVGINITELIIKSTSSSPFGVIGQIFCINYKLIINQIKKYFLEKKIDVIQASNVLELKFTFHLGKALNSPFIYDSHEDYIRQAIDLRQNIAKKIFFAGFFLLTELIYIRKFDRIFCTDEYLLQKYSGKLYCATKVNILRNFPSSYFIKRRRQNFSDKGLLKLVYVGGVNKYRGIIETSKYIKRFNSSHSRKIEFYIYSPPKPLLNELMKSSKNIHIFNWIDYSKLMLELNNYDIGICLWLPIKKFKRNLPLKNFDYMARGLPIITSNFGNLKKYIIESNSGICIDPFSFDEFENAILKMFDKNIRRSYSSNGINWVRNFGNFDNEATEYLKYFSDLNNQENE
jgi:glycosyltransferase involved in cell wall biosynthesis